MARERTLKVIIAGDADKLDREARRAGNSLDKLGKQTRLTASMSSKGYSAMRVGATGAAAGIAGLVVVGKRLVDATIEEEKSAAKLRAQFKASGIDYRAHAKDIEAVIDKHSRLAGVDDEELQDAFTAIVRSTGSVKVAMRDIGLVTDLARAKNISVAKAGELVAKVHSGQTRAVKSLGLEFVKSTANVDKLREANDKVTPAQLKAAKAADDQANSQRALALIQKRVSGQADAFGKTTAGAMQRAGVAVENLEEDLGKALAPTVEKTANKVANFVSEMQAGTGQGGRFAAKLKDVWQETKPIVTWIGRATKNVARFGDEHPGVTKLAAAVIGVGVALKGLKFLGAITGFSNIVKAGGFAARKLPGIFAKQGAAAGAAAGTAAAGSSGMTSAATFNKMRDSGRRVGRVLGKGLVVGIGIGFVAVIPELAKTLKDKLGVTLGGVFGGIPGVGDGIGRDIGSKLGKLVGAGSEALPSGGGGGLKGANPALGPFAALGRQAGLYVGSGKRAAGGLTSSGNISYHGSGEAIDQSGPPAKMLAYFRSMKARFGSRLAELIYSPGGAGIKNGRSHTYTGQVAADHHDHVHLALDLGTPGPGIGRDARPANRAPGVRRPGTGDGIGQAVAAARGAGLSGAGLVTAVAIAGPESRYDAEAVNIGPRDHSIGFWQINQLAHKGRFGTDAQLKNPATNARAMTALSSGGKNWQPWAAYTSGAYRGWIDKARQAVVGSRGKSVGAGAGTSLAKSSSGGASSSASDAGDAETRAGSRLVNRIAAPFFRDTSARNETAGRHGARMAGGGLGINSLARVAAGRERVIGEKDTAYGQAERRFGQTDEDLGTRAGRTQRISEIGELKKLKTAQLKRQQARLKALVGQVAKYDGLIGKLRAQLKGKGRVRGATAARVRERLKGYEDTRLELAAEVRSLGFAIEDTKLDLGDLDKDAAEVASTADTVGDQAEAGPSPTDKLGQALSDIDLQLRAGRLTQDEADAQRINQIRGTLGGYYGTLDQRQQWEVEAQLREAQEQASAATDALAAEVRALREEMAKANQIATSTIGIQLREATRAFGDLLSRELGGRAVVRGSMPGTGDNWRL